MCRAGVATGGYGDCQYNQEQDAKRGTSAGFQTIWFDRYFPRRSCSFRITTCLRRCPTTQRKEVKHCRRESGTVRCDRGRGPRKRHHQKYKPGVSITALSVCKEL